MADTTFVDGVTTVPASWLNDVNQVVYGPTSPAGTFRNQLANTASATLGDFLLGVKRTATGSVATTEHAWHEAQVLDAVADFGMSTGGSAAANTTALAAAVAVATTLGGGIVEIQAGTYALTAGTNFAAANVGIVGRGTVVLTYAGAGTAFVLDAGAGVGARLDRMLIRNLVIKGNASTTVAFYNRGIVRSTIDNVEVRECSVVGFDIFYGVSTVYSDCKFSDGAYTSVTKPLHTWRIDHSSAGYYTADCTFINCVGENSPSGRGLTLINCSGCVWVGGTFEYNSIGTDIQTDAALRNTFINVWYEGNTSNDAIVKGVGNQFQGCNFGSSTSGNTVDITTGSSTVFTGGYVRQASLGASSLNTAFFGCHFSDNGALGVVGAGATVGNFTRVGCSRINTSYVVTAKYPDVVGEKTTWTPTITQSGAVGATLNRTSNRNLGGVVHLYAKLSITGSGTAANAITINAFPTMIAGEVEMPIGTFVLFDTSASTYYQGAVVATTVNTATLQITSVAGAVGVTPNFALASGDVLWIKAFYEVAP